MLESESYGSIATPSATELEGMVQQVRAVLPQASIATIATCLDCVAGKASAAGAESCTQCYAGTFPNASTGLCDECSFGRYSETGFASCVSCVAGYHVKNNNSECVVCDAGKSSASNSETCDDCEVRILCCCCRATICTDELNLIRNTPPGGHVLEHWSTVVRVVLCGILCGCRLVSVLRLRRRLFFNG